MTDIVNQPAHYTAGGIECIDALESATQGLEGQEAFCTANAIKYLWRWKRKNGAEDLKKARWYIERLLSAVEPPPAPVTSDQEPRWPNRAGAGYWHDCKCGNGFFSLSEHGHCLKCDRQTFGKWRG